MTSSGTFDFNPSFSSLILQAFARCGVRRTAVVQEHMEDARMEANLLLADFANRGPNLWSVTLTSETLIPGQATYTVSPQTVMILDAYIRTASGGVDTDRIIMPVSRTEYASYPNKEQTGLPTVYWFDRGMSQTLTLWQVPDASQVYELRYYSYTQIEDAVIPSGATMNLPYRFLNAFVAGLAERLAIIYAPDRLPALKMASQEAWAIASTQDVENVNLYITPGMAGYFR